MGRRDRDINDINEILHIVEESKVLHLGLIDGNAPYIVPLNYGYEFSNGKFIFYVHGSLEGRKIDLIKKNPNCCVQMECGGQLIEGNIACQYGYSYYSFEGFGKAYILDNPEEKMKGLTLLMKEQTDKDFAFNEKLVSVVNVIRIECDSFTAKHRPMPVRDVRND